MNTFQVTMGIYIKNRVNVKRLCGVFYSKRVILQHFTQSWGDFVVHTYGRKTFKLTFTRFQLSLFQKLTSIIFF